MSRKRNDDATDSMRLIDTLLGGPDLGALRGVLATTYDLNPEFFEVDFLPAVFGLGAWDDRRWTSRIALERALATTSAVTVLMDGRRFQGRPRTLRVEVLPAIGERGQVLHAKITLLVFDSAVRLVVSSANLTEPGYRSNREVALCLTATPKRPAEGTLIAQALREARSLLGAWWTDGANAVTTTALTHLADWGVTQETDGEQFVWGGGQKPLWKAFLDEWPTDEAVRRLTIVSPFWSEEHS
ncbi:MAG: phospholipase D family protein, partial [Polyangiaceae bacterium]|nr:phospholipase D family protein [Polyangiaceae bacterium]